MAFQIENGKLWRYSEEPGVTEVIVPEGVTEIGETAFQNCNTITSVVLPDSVKSISENAFVSCRVLTSITIPESVTSFGTFYSIYNNRNPIYAFEKVPWFDKFPGKLVIAGKNVLIRYSGTKKDIVIPEGCERINDYAFYNRDKLVSLVIPNSVTEIGESAFCGCSSLKAVTMSENVTKIEDNTFNGCASLESITIPKSVTSIGSDAFRDCRSLTSVTIASSVTHIGSTTFSGCSALESIEVDPDNEHYASIDGVLYDKDLYGIIHVPAKKTEITVPKNTGYIENEAFKGCFFLKA